MRSAAWAGIHGSASRRRKNVKRECAHPGSDASHTKPPLPNRFVQAGLLIQFEDPGPRVMLLASDAWTEVRLRRLLADLEPLLSRWRLYDEG
jgi:hypothetical protein